MLPKKKSLPKRDMPTHRHIQEEIVHMLLQQQLMPGTRIVESKMCEQLGVSRTPLREALFKLEQKGLVHSNLARGFSVNPFSSKEVKELYPVIWTLESLAMRLSQNRISVIIEKLRAINKSFAKAGISAGRAVQIDSEFHEALTEQCHNQYLLDELYWLRRLILRYEIAYMNEKAHIERSGKQHGQIIEALMEKNLDLASSLLEKNWRQGMDLIVDWLEWDKVEDGRYG